MDPIGFSFNLEKVHGQGEDAEPIHSFPAVSQLGHCWVFDGLGGAGSKRYVVNGEEIKGARLASRFARDVVDEYLKAASLRSSLPLDDDQSKLTSLLQNRIRARADVLETSRIKGKLMRRLPTTVAGMAVSTSGTELVGCEVVWAGDSRCYSLDPTHGLRQLTLDDSDGDADALFQLLHDPKITNCINADESFHLSRRVFAFNSPVALFAATDGCFGYLPSPVHFEKMLLDTMSRAATDEEWKKELCIYLNRVSGDDASMALVACGWCRFSDLKNSFCGRRKELASKTGKMGALESNIKSQEEKIKRCNLGLDQMQQERIRLRDGLWEEYKATYYSALKASKGEVENAKTFHQANEASPRPGSRQQE